VQPEKIIEEINSFLERYPWAENGPAHIVLSDQNLADHWIDSCLNYLYARSGGPWDWEHIRADEVEVTVAFLKWLRSIPEELRDRAESLCHGDF
jgi:hypothetical protein